MRLYYFIGRLIHPFMVVGFYLFSIVTHTPRVRTVLKNEYGEILLVQSWSGGDIWGLPGGGVERHESASQAAHRELLEETGINLKGKNIEEISRIAVWGHQEIIFLGEAKKSALPSVVPNRYEIKNANWFPVDSMPKLGPLAKEVVGRMVSGH